MSTNLNRDQQMVQLIELANAQAEAAQREIAGLKAELAKTAALSKSWQKVAETIPAIVERAVATDRIVDHPAMREKLAATLQAPENWPTVLTTALDTTETIHKARKPLGGPDHQEKRAGYDDQFVPVQRQTKAIDVYNRILHGENGAAIR